MGLNLALTGATLLGGLFNGAQSRGNMNMGTNYWQQAANTAGQSYRNLVDTFNTAVASGAYDPNQAIDLANRTAAQVFKTQEGNMGTQYARLGFKPGDSNIDDSTNNLSAQSQLQLANQRITLGNQYNQQKLADQGAVSSAGDRYSGILQGLGNDYVGLGQTQQQQNGFGSALGAISSLGSGYKSSGGGGGGYGDGTTGGGFNGGGGGGLGRLGGSASKW